MKTGKLTWMLKSFWNRLNSSSLLLYVLTSCSSAFWICIPGRADTFEVSFLFEAKRLQGGSGRAPRCSLFRIEGSRYDHRASRTFPPLPSDR